DAMSALRDAGIPTALMVSPVIPALTDHEIDRILEAGHSAGATEARYVLLRLPLEVSPLFRDWLLRNYPDRYRHVMSPVRSMRGGKDYDAEFGKRMKRSGPYAWEINRRFQMAIKRLGMGRRGLALRDDLFIPPDGGSIQLSLL